MSEPTTIIWYTLPSKGNDGAAIVKWRETTYDTAPYRGRIVGDYLLGLRPARYPVPAIVMDYSPQHLVDMHSMRMAAISYAGY